MKKKGLKLALLILICVVTSFVQSCEKEVDWQNVRHLDRIEVMTNNQVTSYYVFSYDGNKINKIEEFTDHILKSRVEFQYNGDKMTSWKYYYNYPYGLFAKETVMFEYKGKKIIRAIAKEIDEKGAYEDTVEYTYSGDKLKDVLHTGKGWEDNDIRQMELVWSGDNVSRVLFPYNSGIHDYTIYMDFDNKKNPIRFPMGFLPPNYSIFDGDFFNFLSENNITKVTWYEIGDGYGDGYYAYTYTYDEDGYPLTKTMKYNQKWVYHYCTE